MKTLRALFGIAFIVVAVYACWMLIPPYFNNYKLEDAIAEEARLATYSSRNENDIRESVYKKAIDYDVPVTREQINVVREGQSVSITIDYRVHLDFPGYPVDLNFHTSSKNKAY